nr:hypothetical protein [Gordonia sp. LAM0048]
MATELFAWLGLSPTQGRVGVVALVLIAVWIGCEALHRNASINVSTQIRTLTAYLAGGAALLFFAGLVLI